MYFFRQINVFESLNLIRALDCVITVSADDVAPNGARPSAYTVQHTLR